MNVGRKFAEPKAFNPEDIARFLEEQNRPGFARMVRSLSDMTARANTRERHMRERLEALRAKYEPRERQDVVSFQPPPEASD